MARKVIRNDAGEPFSRWKPAEKFEYVFRNSEWPDLFERCVKELQFFESRRWRFDYAWEEIKLAVEIDGFGFGHQAQQNIAANNEKRNQAVRAGWRVLVFDSRLIGTTAKVKEAVELVAECICEWD